MGMSFILVSQPAWALQVGKAWGENKRKHTALWSSAQTWQVPALEAECLICTGMCGRPTLNPHSPQICKNPTHPW